MESWEVQNYVEIKQSNLNNRLKKEIPREIRKYFEMNENEWKHSIPKCDVTRIVFTGKYWLRLYYIERLH